jgi:hypothetical protein
MTDTEIANIRLQVLREHHGYDLASLDEIVLWVLNGTVPAQTSAGNIAARSGGGDGSGT